MNANPIPSLNDTAKMQSQTVCIQIDQKDTPMLLSFLLSKQISFDLIYQPPHHKTSLIPDQQEEPVATQDREMLNKEMLLSMSVRQKIEWAYEYYIQQKCNEAIPSEDEIASQIDMASSQFRSLFKRIYGQGFYQLYLAKRMEHASKLLRKGFKCNEVAKAVGYGTNSAIKFNKMFQKHFGITPKKYQLKYVQ